MQAGTEQVAAGYVLLYGPSTMLALTVGRCCILYFDPKLNNLYLLLRSSQVSADTQEFAINSSNQRHWENPVKRYIDELLAEKHQSVKKISICVGLHVWWVIFTVFYAVAVSSFILMI
jgi:fructose-1,6-bisphosphatase I